MNYILVIIYSTFFLASTPFEGLEECKKELSVFTSTYSPKDLEINGELPLEAGCIEESKLYPNKFKDV